MRQPPHESPFAPTEASSTLVGPLNRARLDIAATWVGVAAISALTVAGALVRIARVGDRVLSFDEGYTVAIAQRSFVDMLQTFRFEANGMLYTAVLWSLVRISDSAAMVRAPALVAGLLTIPAVYWAGRALVGRHAALVGATLLAVSPAAIGWSLYARGYAFAALFATISIGCVVRATGRGAPTRWRRLCVIATLAMAYSSALSLALLPVHALLVRMRAGGGDLRVWARPALWLSVALAPLAVMLVVASTYHDPLAWLWRPDGRLLRTVFGEIAAGPTFSGQERPQLALAIGTCALAVVAASLVMSRRQRYVRASLAGVAAWALVPPVLLLVVSFLHPVLWGRYLAIVVPGLALLLGAALASIPRIVTLVYGLVLASLLLGTSLTTPSPGVDFRVVGAWVEANRAPDEPLVLYPIEQLPPLAYYIRRLRVEGVLPVEEWDDTPLPRGVLGYHRDIDWGDTPLGPPRAEDLERLVSRSRSVLVLTYPNLSAHVPLAWATEAGCTIDHPQFHGLQAISIRGCAGLGA
jgi:hypothetical protein